jgi:hypothetical protein
MDLAALAMTGATALVGAMATDAWQVAREGIARLFRRRGADHQASIEAQLDRNADLVSKAPDAERARQSLIALWELELTGLMAQDPGAAAELTALITEVHSRLPAAGQQWVQANAARDHGTVFAVQGGNLFVHPAPPGRADEDEAPAP